MKGFAFCYRWLGAADYQEIDAVNKMNWRNGMHLPTTRT
jgi:hypothetical protein